MKRFLALVLSVQIAAATAGAALAAPMNAEIGQLLDYIEHSGCTFYRNGSWYDALTARHHLEGKVQYAIARGALAKTEDFIDKIATRSSYSGRSYEIKCGDAQPMPSAPWLSQQLQRQRGGNAPN